MPPLVDLPRAAPLAGPTTECLDVDFKGLRADFHRLEVNVNHSIATLERSVNASVARVEIAQAKQEAVLGVFRALVLGSLGAAIVEPQPPHPGAGSSPGDGPGQVKGG